MSAAIVFALTIVLPNLVLMVLGFYMRKKGEIGQVFIDQASKMVFNYALPCLLFLSVANSEVNYVEQFNLIGAGLVVTFILFFGSELYVSRFVKSSEDKGVFVQGVYRSNMAIIGLATVTNAYGEQGLSVAAVYMGVLTIVFNILAVITLSRVSVDGIEGGQNRLLMIVKKLLSNPLIIALGLAFIYQLFGLPKITGVMYQTGALLATIALPLALICAGATLDIKSMLHPSGLSTQASVARIFIAPMVAVAVGLVFGLQGVQMGVLFLMVASPTAVASYVMAKAMGGNDVLAANIVAFTTVFSLFGMAIGAGLLRGMGLM